MRSRSAQRKQQLLSILILWRPSSVVAAANNWRSMLLMQSFCLSSHGQTIVMLIRYARR